MRKSIAFDFDGVIHSYTSGWKGYDVIPDPVVPGIREVIRELRKRDYYIIVFSTRAYHGEGVDAMWRYLEDNEIYVDQVTNSKEPWMLLVDDRCLQFTGDTSNLLDKILNFKPVNVPDLTVEDFAKELHEAGREAVERKCTVGHSMMDEDRPFLEWNEITEEAKEGRRIQARYLLSKYNVIPK